MKDPEPSQTVQTVQPAGGAAMSAPSVDAPPGINQQLIEKVQQSADAHQATLLAV